MEEYYLDGEKYFFKNGKWLTSSYGVVPLAMASKLNKLKLRDDDFESKSMEELLKIIDGARASENIQLASKILEVAIDKATVQEIRNLLPRLTSNYRRMGMPQIAIDVSKSYTDVHKKKVWSPALFTSLAAAYCYLDDFVTGRKFANLAKSISGTEASPELISVYKRIKEAENR